MTTRNGILFRGFWTTSREVALCTVPAGVVWIVKWISIRDWAASPIPYITLRAEDVTRTTTVYVLELTDTHNVVNVQTWVTLEPGDLLFLNWPAGRIDLWLGGASLPAPPPVP